jgi:hypothetical protein
MRKKKGDALARNIEKKTEQNDISYFICTFVNIKKTKEQMKDENVKSDKMIPFSYSR